MGWNASKRHINVSVTVETLFDARKLHYRYSARSLPNDILRGRTIHKSW